jgi:transposase
MRYFKRKSSFFTVTPHTLTILTIPTLPGGGSSSLLYTKTMQLTKKVIKARMIELQNLRKLHTKQKITIAKQSQIIKTLRAENKALKLELQTQKLQIAELQVIVFGKKKKQKTIHLADIPTERAPHQRSSSSYHRSTPKSEEVTEIVTHPEDTCSTCTTPLIKTTSVEYYVIDIPPTPPLEVIKHLTIRGYCTTCKKSVCAIVRPDAEVTFGPRVKRLVCYLSTTTRLSYGGIQTHLKNTHDFIISQGEIAKILRNESKKLEGPYDALLDRIRSESSVHIDESTWKRLDEGTQSYIWTLTGGESGDSVFQFGKSRGKAVALDLLGASQAVVVSDGYGAYTNIENAHQLCTVHPLRKLRDLAQNREIPSKVRKVCEISYRLFSEMYTLLKKTLIEDNPLSKKALILEKIYTFSTPHKLDPQKLSAVKKHLLTFQENYLTCLSFPFVSPDNNAAERSLRHLVIKRKTSFGSYNDESAQVMEVLYSVIMDHGRHGRVREWLRSGMV